MPKLPSFLKPVKKSDSLRSVWIYREGWAVASFERHDRDTDNTSYYCKLAAPGLIDGMSGDAQRLIVQPAMARIIFTLPGKVWITAHAANIEQGTTNTKNLNLRVASLSISSALGNLLLSSIPDQMATDWDARDTVGDVTLWQEMAGKTEWNHRHIANPEVLPPRELTIREQIVRSGI